MLELTRVQFHTFACSKILVFSDVSKSKRGTPRQDHQKSNHQKSNLDVAPHHYHHVQKLQEIDASAPEVIWRNSWKTIILRYGGSLE